MFTLVDKKDDEKTGDDMLSVIKYKPANPHHIMTLKSVEDYSNHIDNVQSDLDSLKDLLHNDAYQLETNQLLGVSKNCYKAWLPSAAHGMKYFSSKI